MNFSTWSPWLLSFEPRSRSWASSREALLSWTHHRVGPKDRIGQKTFAMPIHAPCSSAPNEPGTQPNGDYLDRLMRRASFQALWPLFSNATKPAKEMTESFSALSHLRPLIKQVGSCRVIHVGDGAHARTAALFALKTSAENISVDPLINERIVGSWRDEFRIERLSWRKARLAEVADELNALPSMPVFVTFVHAHVDVDEELARLRWDAAFTLACCSPGKQLSKTLERRREGQDFSVLSPEREFQVLVPRTES